MQNFRPHSDKFENGKQCRRLIRLSVYVFARVELLSESTLFIFLRARTLSLDRRTLKSQLRRREAATKRRRERVCQLKHTHAHTHTEHYGKHTYMCAHRTENRETKLKLCRKAIQNAANGKRRNQSHEVAK